MPNGTENSRENGQGPELEQKFRNERNENCRSIWCCTGISGNFGRMNRAHRLFTLRFEAASHYGLNS